MHLARFPRAHLCHVPTPLEPLLRLTELLGGPTLWIKRDDCTGLATGGNKARKLEFLLGDAIEQRATVIVTVGAVQSNHARQTAAAAAKLGLPCELVLERCVPGRDETYETTGNVLLDRLLGARVHLCELGERADDVASDLCDQLRANGERPYFIPTGGSNPVGALGYASCAMELLQQANQIDLELDAVVHASGSAGTQAGLVAGFEVCHTDIDVVGVSVQRAAEEQVSRVSALCNETIGRIGAQQTVKRDRIRVDDRFVGPGYGIPTQAMVEAVSRVAAQEGVLLDPVYTGKAMAGLLAMVGEGRFAPSQNIVFLHTGGAVGLFAYGGAFERGAVLREQ